MVKDLHILSCNIEGLIPRKKKYKCSFLKELCEEKHALALCLTESHLKAEIKNEEIKIEGMTPFRCDRKQQKKGGVIIYVKDKFAALSEVLLSETSGLTEILAINIRPFNLLLVTLYRPPRCSISDFLTVISKLRSKFEDLESPTPNIILTGDFNLPNVCWSTESIYGGTTDDRKQAEYIFSLTNSWCLNQKIKEPTREKNILDLFWVNNEEIIDTIEVTPTAISDHNIITVKTNLKSNSEMKKPNNISNLPNFSHYNFFSNKLNWESLQTALLNVPWEMEMAHLSVEEKYKFFVTKLLQIVQNYAPVRVKKSRSIIPRDRRILMRKRSRLKTKLKNSKNTHNSELLKAKILSIECQLCKSHSEQRQREEEFAISAIQKNSKFFYNYAKKYSKTSIGVGPLVGPDGTTTAELQDMCQLLSNQYNSVFSTPRSMLSPICNNEEDTNQQNILSDFSFGEIDFQEACKELKPNSAAGPDEVPAIILNKCRNQLSLPLKILWTASFNEGIIPMITKSAYITPIYKGGGKSSPENYRPVALTSHVIKVFEKILGRKLMLFFDEHQLINKGQHGFRRGRSCLSQLLGHYTKILEIMETGAGADVLYLDFSKAFDKVDHGILLQKLYKLGITGKFWKWIRTFLMNRKQTVIIEGQKSDPSTVISGVPQGSVLGPLLFLTLLNDIDQDVDSSMVTSFADDTRITGIVNNQADVESLKNDLGTIYKWAEKNNMWFNDSKFELLRYNKRTEAVYETGTKHKIDQEDTVKDLGIMITPDASFSTHINTMTKSARTVAGWILRVFATREAKPMLQLFKSLVIPKLEYCCILWNPHMVKEIQQIESIQRSFTAKIVEVQHLNYWERLKRLKLYSLERRRERYIILYVFKILNGLVPNIGITAKHHQRRGRECARPYVNDRVPTATKKRNAFIYKGPLLFNCLPQEIRNMTTPNIVKIKNEVDKFLMKIPDQPNLPHYYAPVKNNSIIEHLQVMQSNGVFIRWPTPRSSAPSSGTQSIAMPAADEDGGPRQATHQSHLGAE
jgi:hypothetical protein